MGAKRAWWAVSVPPSLCLKPLKFFAAVGAGNKLLSQMNICDAGRHQTGTFMGRQYGSDQNNDYAEPLLFCHWQPTFSLPIILINSVIFPKSGLYRALMRNLIKRCWNQAIWAAAGIRHCTFSLLYFQLLAFLLDAAGPRSATVHLYVCVSILFCPLSTLTVHSYVLIAILLTLISHPSTWQCSKNKGFQALVN